MSMNFQAGGADATQAAVRRGCEVLENMQRSAHKRMYLSFDPADSLRRVKRKKQTLCQYPQAFPPSDRERMHGAAPTPRAVSMVSVPVAANHAQISHVRFNHEIAARQADILEANVHIWDVRTAKGKMCDEIAARGRKYRNNSKESLGGFMVENAVGESINVDAAIQKKDVRAVVPDSNKAGSADIVVTNGAGIEEPNTLKFHGTASGSARAQTDPRLDGQRKVIPADQLAEGKASLERRAHREELRGRPDAAKRQRDTAAALTDRIEVDGVESVALTRKNALDLAKAVSVDENGEAVVDMAKIDAVLKETGLTEKIDTAVKQEETRIEDCEGAVKKARNACVRAELKCAAAAAGIAALTSAATTAAITLIENGASLEALQAAAVNGAQSGAEGGAVALGVYGATRTVGASLYSAAVGALTNAGVVVTENIAAGVGVGVMGAVATTAVSVYTFGKMKLQGASTREALCATGKNAVISMGIAVVASATTLAFGVAAGAMVSAVIGMGIIGFSLFKAFRARRSRGGRRSFAAGWATGCLA